MMNAPGVAALDRLAVPPGLAASAVVGLSWAQAEPLRIGVLTDFSGAGRANSGPGSLAGTQANTVGVSWACKEPRAKACKAPRDRVRLIMNFISSSVLLRVRLNGQFPLASFLLKRFSGIA